MKVICLFAAVLLAACGTGLGDPLDCQPRALSPTGNLASDLVGSWDAFGIDSRVVFNFRADGVISTVEEPNQFAPSGGIGTSHYIVQGGKVLIDSTEYSASISQGSLTLTDAGASAAVRE